MTPPRAQIFVVAVLKIKPSLRKEKFVYLAQMVSGTLFRQQLMQNYDVFHHCLQGVDCPPPTRFVPRVICIIIAGT